MINLTATPGLGSLLARRYVAGTGQLLLALAGFVLILDWMLAVFSRAIRQQMGEPVSSTVPGWLWKWGLICFVAGWLWSLATSLSLLRQAKADQAGEAQPVPPKLADLPGQPPKLS